jgi:hypothetical protein
MHLPRKEFNTKKIEQRQKTQTNSPKTTHGEKNGEEARETMGVT